MLVKKKKPTDTVSTTQIRSEVAFEDIRIMKLAYHWKGINVCLRAFMRFTLKYWSSELCIKDSLPLCVVCVCVCVRGARVDSNCPTLIYVVRTLNTDNEIRLSLNEADNHCLTTTSH